MVRWTAASVLPSGSNSWNAVAFGNSTFVAVGANIMTSTDNGNTWTLCDLPFTKPGGWSGFTCITYGDNEFLAIGGTKTGNYSYVIKSQDGISWNYVPSGTYNSPLNNGNWTSVAYQNNYYVAVTNTKLASRIMISTDGGNWTSPELPPNYLNQWECVTAGNGMFITVGLNSINNANTNVIYSNDNGSTWSNSNIYGLTNSIGFKTIIYANEQFVALGSTHVAVTSNNNDVNGITWKTYKLPTNQSLDWRSMAYGNGRYVAVCKLSGGDFQAMVCSDLVTWTTLRTPVRNLTSIVSGNGYFVAVSANGSAMVASDMETPTLGSFTISSLPYNSSKQVTITPPTSNSNGTWSYQSSNLNVATISENKITIRDVGSAVITATQAATSSYSSATATTTFVVTQATTVMGALAISSTTYGKSFTITAPTSTNTETSITYSSSDSDIISISGNVATANNLGTVTITASQPETSRFTAASTFTDVTVTKGSHTIINTWSIPSKTFGDAPFNITNPVTSSSTTFTYESSNSNIASVSGNRITIKAAGTVTITCKLASTIFFDSKTITTPFTVKKAIPNITGFTMPTVYYGHPTFSFSNVISNSPGVITYKSSKSSVASITGTTVSIGNVGQTTITLTQDESNNYLKKVITATLTVNKANPNLGPLLLPSSIPYSNNSSLTLTIPTSLSSSAFNFTSSNTSVATIGSGSLYNIVKIVGVGNSIITATQSESANYVSASVTVLLTVPKGTPDIGIIQLPSIITFGDSPYTFSNPTSTSSGIFTYRILDTSIARINDNTITLLKPGQTSLICEQSETTYYSSASVSVLFTVRQGTPDIGSLQLPSSITFGDSPYTFNNPTSPSLGSFTYTILDTSIARINDNTITFLKPGQTSIICEQSATTYYSSASVLVGLTVNKATPDIGRLQLSYGILGDIPFEIDDPTSPSPGLFSYTSSNNSVATINGKLLTIVGLGTTEITVTQSATDYYTSKSETVNFEVVQPSTTLSYTVNNNTPSVNPTYPPYQDEYMAISPSIIFNGITYPMTTISAGAFANCANLRLVLIPSTVNTIGQLAFSNCKSLDSITIPNLVTQINNSTFFSCSSLQSFTMPNSIRYIGENAFANCTSLMSVTLSESLTTIGPSAFENCKKLTMIYIPSSVTTIGTSAFSSIFNLSIYFESTSNLPTFSTTTSINSFQMKAYYKEGVKTPSGETNVTSYLLGLGFKTVQTY